MGSVEPEFIAIGQVLAPYGLNGKFRVAVATDFPQRFSPSATIYVDHRPMMIASTEQHQGKLTIKVNDVDTREAAQRLQGLTIEIPAALCSSLPNGQYYHFQLVGREVWTNDGRLLGRITQVLNGYSNDNYLVSGAGGEVLIPAIDDVVQSIDLEKGRVVIALIPGLLDSDIR